MNIVLYFLLIFTTTFYVKSTSQDKAKSVYELKLKKTEDIKTIDNN